MDTNRHTSDSQDIKQGGGARTLRTLPLGASARITHVGGEGALRQHFLDMGVIPGAVVTLEKFAPMGDPMQLRLHGYALTLRLDDAAMIGVEPVGAPTPQPAKTPAAPHEIPHPGLGEGGRYHDEEQGPKHKASKSQPLRFALIGNQDTGKTTLFNQLTGPNQHVGPIEGVDIEMRQGTLRHHPEVVVVNLPDIYSLSAYTSDEEAARRFLLEGHPDGIINVVDATNIERNLYLTMQLMELGLPMVIALNMMDEMDHSGASVRINEMESRLGVPVVAISAMKGEGVHEVVRHALHVARHKEAPQRQDFCDEDHHGGAVHRCLHAIMHLVDDHAQRAHIPTRFAASRLAEGDESVAQALSLDTNEMKTIRHITTQMEEERGLDRQAAMADMRYAYIHAVTADTVVRPHTLRTSRRTRFIDRVLTGRWTALPAFALIMGAVFYLTFDSLGIFLQGLCQSAVDWTTALIDRTLTAWHIAPAVHSLIVDGVCTGVGTVLTFIPLVVVLFFFLSLLEDTGYMARIAFFMDKLLRRLGLSGRSIVPLLIGFGCSVASVMACRTLPSARDRRMAIMLTPFMSCTSKMPVYGFFAAIFFPGHAGLVVGAMYAIGIVMGIVMALVLGRTFFKGDAVPFVLELPPYRLPAPRNVARLLWEKAIDYLGRAFTIIFVASIVIWFFQTFNFRLQMVGEAHEESMLAAIAGLVAPVFSPLGFGDWRIVVGLLSGLLSKEMVISSLATLTAGISVEALFTAKAAFSLLVFYLLYPPCMASISTVRHELGGAWATRLVVFQCLIAYAVAFLFSLL